MERKWAESEMTAEKKKWIRKRILEQRDAIPEKERAEKSRKITEALWTMPFYRESDVILTYVNHRSEVNTTDLVNKALADGKQVFAPKVCGETLVFYRIEDMNDLKEGYRGIREPVSGPVFCPETGAEHALMLMPGAVFDEGCHRIGYGKGYYDRYLKWMAEEGAILRTLALCFECQVLPEIPSERHDIRPQMILTERKLRQTHKTAAF